MPCLPLVRMVFSAQLARLRLNVQWPVLTLFNSIYLRVYWMIYRGQAFSPSYHLATSSTGNIQLHTGRLRKIGNLLTGGKGGRGWGRTQIIGWRERLVFYKSFNTLWPPQQELVRYYYSYLYTSLPYRPSPLLSGKSLSAGNKASANMHVQ